MGGLYRFDIVASCRRTGGMAAPHRVPKSESTMSTSSGTYPTRTKPHDVDLGGTPHRLAGVLLLAQFACMWTAFFILMPAINWPASLGEPPSVILPLILERAGPVFAGYASYLLHALLLIPLAIVLRRTLRMSPLAGAVGMTLGILAGLAKALGIVRWLFLMPGLALAYVDPSASDATKAAIEVVYGAFNAYAGGVGELLGVGLFAGAWTVLVSVGMVRLGGGAQVLGYSGLVAAAGLLSTVPSVVGIESPILLTLSGVVWQLWTAAVAVWHLRTR
jgi:Domain of unknown function (DUF4386)